MELVSDRRDRVEERQGAGRHGEQRVLRADAVGGREHPEEEAGSRRD